MSNKMQEYKLISLVTNLPICENIDNGPAYFESAEESWNTLRKLAKKNTIATLWVYQYEEPLFLNKEKVIKAYTTIYGENPHGIPLREYWRPLFTGMTYDEYSI